MKKSIYTCHSENLDTAPRKGTHKMHTVFGVVDIYTEWKAIECGHITSKIDDKCNGCSHQRKLL